MRDMRRGNCPHCDHYEIVQANPSAFGFYAVAGWKIEHELNVFVCRRCGFAQWFAYKPDTIVIAEEKGTRLIKGTEPTGPYR